MIKYPPDLPELKLCIKSSLQCWSLSLTHFTCTQQNLYSKLAPLLLPLCINSYEFGAVHVAECFILKFQTGCLSQCRARNISVHYVC